jgi:release factor glutamine methyltransferase
MGPGGSGGVGALLRDAIGVLSEAGLPTAHQDGEWLLADLLGVRRFDLYLNPERPVPASVAERYREMVKRRRDGEPLQQILGWEEFRGARLRVTPDVLIPRQETELLVEWALELLDRLGDQQLAVDLGTGSGAIACALALAAPRLRVVGVDTSPDALSVAEGNVKTLGLESRVMLLAGDLFEPLGEELRGTADLVIANPPYIPTGEISKLPPEVREREPRAALDGGQDGMVFHRRIIAEAPRHLKPGGWLLMEIGEGQSGPLAEAMRRGGLEEVQVRRDFRGIERMIGGRRSEDGGPAFD